MKYFEDAAGDVITGLKILSDTPLVYRLKPMSCGNVKYLKETASVVAPGLGSRVALHDIQLDAGPNADSEGVCVAAQGNSIHTIVKYLEDTAGDVTPGLEIPKALHGLRARCRPRTNSK